MRLVEDTSDRNDAASILLNASSIDIQNQQKLFGSIVGLRVAVQPVIAAIDRLPANKFALDYICELNPDIDEKSTELAMEADKFLASLIVLQDKLWERIEDINESGLEISYDESESDIDENTNVLTEPTENNLWEIRKRRYRESASIQELDFLKRMNKRQKKIHDYCLCDADMWKSHCQPSVQKSFKALDQSISWHVKFAMNDAARALSRCSIPASNAKIITPEWEVDHITELEKKMPHMSTALRNAMSFERYDDKDLYVSLLNSAVRGSAAKAGGFKSSSHEGGAQNDLERLRDLRLKSREMQAKKLVDRRASKGRKIRYKEIPKLVAFMAPMPRVRTLDAEVAGRLVESAFQQESI